MNFIKRCGPVFITSVLLLLIGLLQTGCFKKEVEGQVFVVTKGGENIKMGLVDVYVFPEENFRKVASNVTQELLENAKARQMAFRRREASENPLRDGARRLIALKTEVERDSKLSEPYRRDAIELIRKAEAEVNAQEKELETSIRIPKVMEASDLISSELYGLAPAGKSDADGIFRVKARKGDVIYASGSRRVGDESEYYYWVVQVSNPKSRLLISNDNLGMPPEVMIIGLQGGGESAFEDLIADMDDEEAGLAYRLFRASGVTIYPDPPQDLVPDTKGVVFIANLLKRVNAGIDGLRVQAEQARLEAERKAEAFRSWLASQEGKDMVVDVAGVPLEIKWIDPGTFMMGSPSSEEGRFSDEGPQTRVTISKGFWLGKYEVTQAQYGALMGTNPSRFSGSQLPVEQVSWNDAMEFCRKLTERERKAGRLPEGMAYTLPTEAQWEYACRAGTTTRFNTGNAESDLGRAGWYPSNSVGSTKQVGQKAPNAWGLYDMHGNVWEWCLDWKASYPGGSVTDPRGPASGWDRVHRGGGRSDGAQSCRSARRNDRHADYRFNDLGFRLSLSRVP